MKREDGIIDVPRNSCNITTVEAEYERAKWAEGEDERKDPVGHAVRSLAFNYKENRFNSCYSYGDSLKFHMTQPHWNEIEAKIREKGLPSLMKWTEERDEYVWKLRRKFVREQPNSAKRSAWYPAYLAELAVGRKPA